MNNQGMEPGDSALFINGLQAHLDVYDMFTLLETMRSEAKLMEGLYELANQVIGSACLISIQYNIVCFFLE